MPRYRCRQKRRGLLKDLPSALFYDPKVETSKANVSQICWSDKRRSFFFRSLAVRLLLLLTLHIGRTKRTTCCYQRRSKKESLLLLQRGMSNSSNNNNNSDGNNNCGNNGLHQRKSFLNSRVHSKLSFVESALASKSKDKRSAFNFIQRWNIVSSSYGCVPPRGLFLNSIWHKSVQLHYFWLISCLRQGYVYSDT